jgi:hypothetical protein
MSWRPPSPRLFICSNASLLKAATAVATTFYLS